MKKKNRIKRADEFHKMIHEGKKFVTPSFVVYTMERKEEEARIGISLSKKIGNAVLRNKIKRQTRMMCEELVDFEKSGYDAVIIVRHNYKDLSYADNKNNLEKSLVKATII